jgi:hypothetical protein
MSGAQIAREVAAALREVARDVGEGVYLAKLTQVTGAAVNPWDSPSGTTVETELAVMVSDYAQSLIDGTLIRQGDKRVMVEATGPEPTQADKLEIDGAVYQIVNVMPLKPSGVALYYECQARR